MKHTIIGYIVIAVFLPALFSSCAEEKDESADSVQRRILEAYIETHYPGAEPTGSGLYIVESRPGNGGSIQDSTYVMLRYAVSYLNGTLYSYSSEDTARQLGEYSPSRYYGPRIWLVHDCSAGVREVLESMREGGYTKSIIPAWLLGAETGSSISGSEGSTSIYDIWADSLIENVTEYQIGELEKFVEAGFPETDSTEYGFYFYRYHDGGGDTLEHMNYLDVWYIGRYLNGKVFDTNVEDTAKKYGLYNGGTYSTTRFTHYVNEDDAISENSFVTGFSKALWRMRYNDKAVVCFYSDLGYGNEGNSSIPGYTPLFFEIWADDDPSLIDED